MEKVTKEWSILSCKEYHFGSVLEPAKLLILMSITHQEYTRKMMVMCKILIFHHHQCSELNTFSSDLWKRGILKLIWTAQKSLILLSYLYWMLILRHSKKLLSKLIGGGGQCLRKKFYPWNFQGHMDSTCPCPEEVLGSWQGICSYAAC